MGSSDRWPDGDELLDVRDLRWRADGVDATRRLQVHPGDAAPDAWVTPTDARYEWSDAGTRGRPAASHPSLAQPRRHGEVRRGRRRRRSRVLAVALLAVLAAGAAYLVTRQRDEPAVVPGAAPSTTVGPPCVQRLAAPSPLPDLGQDYLDRGDPRREAVRYLQQFLSQCFGRSDVEVDGLFGRVTEGAVVAFQQSQGLDADGEVGPRTWEAMQRYQGG